MVVACPERGGDVLEVGWVAPQTAGVRTTWSGELEREELTRAQERRGGHLFRWELP